MKRYHQTPAMLLAFGLLFSSVPYAALADAPAVAAAATLTQQQAVAKAKAILPAGHAYRTDSMSSLEEGPSAINQYGVPTWRFTFVNTDGDTEDPIRFTLDAQRGLLLGYEALSLVTPPKQPVTREQAQAKARVLLKQYASDVADLVTEMDAPKKGKPSPYEAHTFNFVRVVNGIPFVHDHISISIDSRGELEDYTRTWTDGLTFPEAAPKLTAEQAQALYRKGLNLQLVYQPYIDYMDNSHVKYGLAYVPNLANTLLPSLDATTGVILDGQGKPLQGVGEIKPLAAQAVTARPVGELTREEALDAVKSLPIDLRDYRLQTSDSDSYAESGWSFDYEKENGDTLSLVLSGKTGMLYRFTSEQADQTNRRQAAQVSREEARTTAVKFAQAAYPSLASSISLADFSSNTFADFINGSDHTHLFRFVTLQNGIPVDRTGFSVGIDKTSGDVVLLIDERTYNPDAALYDSQAGTISPEAALDNFMDHGPLSLQYVPVYAEPLYQHPYATKVESVSLAYSPDPLKTPSYTDVLNARTGEWESSLNIAKQLQYAKATDIEGHWAEKELESLVAYGTLQLQDGRVSPDRPISRGELMRVLVKELHADSLARYNTPAFSDVPKTDPNFAYVEEALDQRWITADTSTFRPNDSISREEFAALLVRMLGYRKLASHPETFRTPFADVQPANAHFSEIAIVNSLGLITASGTQFRPAEKVTKAQAAVIVERLQNQWQSRRVHQDDSL